MRAKKIRAEKREQKKKPKMPISGKSVFAIRNIIIKKSSKSKYKN